MKKVLLVAGARPNFMKIAPILRSLERHNDIEAILVHTGQHYDQNMSGTFFKELGIREPDFHRASERIVEIVYDYLLRTSY